MTSYRTLFCFFGDLF